MSDLNGNFVISGSAVVVERRLRIGCGCGFGYGEVVGPERVFGCARNSFHLPEGVRGRRQPAGLGAVRPDRRHVR